MCMCMCVHSESTFSVTSQVTLHSLLTSLSKLQGWCCFIKQRVFYMNFKHPHSLLTTSIRVFCNDRKNWGGEGVKCQANIEHRG